MSKTDNDINAALQSTHSREGGNLGPPIEWIVTNISDVSIKGSQRKPDVDEIFIYVDIGSIDRDQKKISNPQHLLGSEAPSRARKVINQGDVLVSLTRPNLNAVALVSHEYDNNIASTGFEVIKPFVIESRYIFNLVRSQHFIEAISGAVQGALYPAAKSTDVQNFNFALPPLAEQKVIADKLDELLAQVDTLKARLDAIPATLKRFRQSVLAAAVSGKLTEEWRSEIDSKITSWEGNFNAEKIEEQIEPFTIPNTWAWDHLGNITQIHNNARIPVKQSDRDARSGQYPYYGAFGIIDDIDDFIFNGGYILLAEDGKNLEVRSRPISLVARGKFWVNNHAHVLSANENISLEYLNYFLNSPTVLIDQFLTGQDQVKLNRKAMILIPVTIPPIEEQTEIVRRVEQFFTYADQVEQQVKNAQTRVNQLTQSILAKAFRGELTEQWRQDNSELISGDNSAAALLERIKAERAAATTSKKKAPARKAKA